MARRNPTTETRPNEAAIYCRVSTTEQAETGVSLDMQLIRCREYAEAHGLNVTEVCVDAGLSGKDIDHRPEMKRLMGLVKARTVTHVVTWKLDRLFRDAVDARRVTALWRKQGATLHAVAEAGTVSLESADDRFLFGLKAELAELERGKIAERTRAALSRKRERNEYTGGQAPFGFMVSPDGSLCVNEREAAVVKEVLRLRRKGLSLRSIGLNLATRKILNRCDKAFSRTQIQKIVNAA